MPGGCARGGSRRLLVRRDTRGPIFHAKTSSGKIVAQVRYASRLPRIPARQDYLGRILLPIHAGGREKCDQNHSIYMKMTCRMTKIAFKSPNARRVPRPGGDAARGVTTTHAGTAAGRMWDSRPRLSVERSSTGFCLPDAPTPQKIRSRSFPSTRRSHGIITKVVPSSTYA